MAISRRKFVKASAVAAAFAALPLKHTVFAQSSEKINRQFDNIPPVQIPYKSQLDPLFHLRQSAFTPHLNTTVRVRAAGASRVTTLTLVEVSPTRGAAKLKDDPNAGENSYSLVFAGARASYLPQGVYTVEHAALGNLTLLLVPINRREGKTFFAEAVINHPLP
ncbi:MAG: twin-arginine translocation signal domain-containing protein [Pyrinomonadaceae bacterium]